MARLTFPLSLRRSTGRAVALGVVAAAVGLGYCTQARLERRPRTHDAYLFADSVGVTPEVSGRVVGLPVRENQRVAQGDLLLEIEVVRFAHQARPPRGPDVGSPITLTSVADRELAPSWRSVHRNCRGRTTWRRHKLRPVT